MANAGQCIQLQKTELYRHNLGADFQKFYRRPLLPFLNPQVPKLRLPSHLDYLEHESVEGKTQNAEKHCYMLPSSVEYVQNRGTQTDYRESESQTSPWEPPYKIAPGHNPEVLTLAHLTWKKGLPVGMHEVEIINRMRMRRAWEAVLPPMNSKANIKLRKSVIAALEADNWSFREAEIEFIMNMRMDLAQKIIETRNDEWDKKRKDRFTRLGSSLGQRRDKEIRNIRQKFGRELRKLAMKHRCKSGKRFKRQDIIKKHVDPASQIYSHQMRFGENPQRRREVLQKRFIREDLVDSMLESLSKNVSKMIFQYYPENCVQIIYRRFSSGAEKIDTRPSSLPTIKELKLIKPKPKPGDLCVKETRWSDEKLEELYKELKNIRLNVQPAESICLLERKQKPLSVPPTPLRPGEQTVTENVLDQAAVLIQKTVRGRAIQYMMFEGRERCRELIEELRSTHALQNHDKKALQKQKTKVLGLQHEQNFRYKQETRLSEILSSLEGMTVSGILDFLSKELLRLQDERRAHAFALLAERERSRREAAEGRRRQTERQRRRELDEIFRQVVKVNQDSVEAYLEDVVKESIDWVSEKEAKEYVMVLADKIDSVSKYVAENAAELDEEEMASDMVYNFVLPEVEKEILRKRIREKQQSYLNTAHAAIYDQILDLPSEEQSESEKKSEIADSIPDKKSFQVSFVKAKEEILTQEDYKNIIETMIDQIISYVTPDENEDIIRDILNETIMEILGYNEAESINEFSFTSYSSSQDLP